MGVGTFRFKSDLRNHQAVLNHWQGDQGENLIPGGPPSLIMMLIPDIPDIPEVPWVPSGAWLPDIRDP